MNPAAPDLAASASMLAEAIPSMGFAHFIAQTDAVGKTLLVILLRHVRACPGRSSLIKGLDAGSSASAAAKPS
jgi:hypothetical protein